MGLIAATETTPIRNAMIIGAVRLVIADRPDARVTTSSDDRASPRNSASVANIVIKGRIR